MICQVCGQYKKVKPHRELTAKYCSQACHNKGAIKEQLGCPKCGTKHKRSKQGLCPSCAEKKWYKTCDKKTLFKKIYDYNKKHKAKRDEWVYRWKLKVGLATPRELKYLRRAGKYLEQALVKARQYKRTGYTSS